MKSILWAQNETPTTPNTIIINGGEPKAYDSSAEHRDAMKTLSNIRDNVKDLWEIDNLKQRGEIRAGLYIKEAQGGFLIASYYIERDKPDDNDKQGREMPYMFYGQSQSLKLVVEELKNVSEKIGRHPNSEELNKAVEANEQKKKILNILKFIGVFITILAIWALLSHKDVENQEKTTPRYNDRIELDTTKQINKQ